MSKEYGFVQRLLDAQPLLTCSSLRECVDSSKTVPEECPERMKEGRQALLACCRKFGALKELQRAR